MASTQIIALSVLDKTMPAVRARSFCRATVFVGPGIKSAEARRFMARSIARPPKY